MKRLIVLVDLFVLATYTVWTCQEWGTPPEWINILVVLLWAPLLVSDIRSLGGTKPGKHTQLLRGARLALRHFKDYYHAVDRADLEFLTDFHVREYRQLTYAGRLAYNHWQPSKGLVRR